MNFKEGDIVYYFVPNKVDFKLKVKIFMIIVNDDLDDEYLCKDLKTNSVFHVSSRDLKTLKEVG